MFAINEISGQITTAQPFNTRSGEYDLVVIAGDQGEPPLESNRTLHVTVLDVNNDIPAILYPTQDEEIYINEVSLIVRIGSERPNLLFGHFCSTYVTLIVITYRIPHFVST